MKGELETKLELGPMKWNETEEGLKIEGVAIEEGTFTGQDGHTIRWNPEIFPEIASTLKGGDIELSHDGHKGGLVTGTRETEDSVLFKGLIIDDFGKKLVKEGKGASIDAQVTARQLEDGTWEPISVNSPKIAIVDRPASEGARVQKVVPVQLERDDSQAGTEDKEKEVSSQMAKNEQLWPKVFDALKDEGYEEEEARSIIDVLQNFISSEYPKSEENSAELGELISEGMRARESLPEVFDSLVQEGFSPTEVSKIVDSVKDIVEQESEEEPSDVKEGEEEPEEDGDEETAQLEEIKEERDEYKEKYEELKSELHKARLEKLSNQIKKIDADFDREEFLSDVEDPETQEVMLERYKDRMEKISDKEVKLSMKETGSDDARAEKIVSDLFGDIPEVIRESE